MSIKLGATSISDIRLGSTQISKVCLGSTEIYSNVAPTPTAIWYIDNEQGDVTINYDIDMDILQNFITTNNVDSLINVTWPARQTKTPTWKVDTDSGLTFRYSDQDMYENLGVTCAWGSGTPSFDIVKG